MAETTPIPVAQPIYSAPASPVAPTTTAASAPTAASSTVSAIPLTASAVSAQPTATTAVTPAAAAPKAAAPAPVASAAPAAPKKTNLREQTVQSQDDYMAYINAVKSGNDPITAKIRNDLLKAQNASGQRTMDRMRQELAAAGQLGQGAGNAQLAIMARDFGLSTSELASKLTSSELQRIENMNKLGYDTAMAIEDRENTYVKNQVDYYAKNGQWDEAQAIYNQNAERLGLPPLDLTSPDSQQKFTQEYAQYQKMFQDIEDQYKNDGNYEAFVARWNDLKNKNSAFAAHAGMIPPSQYSLVDAQTAQNRANAVGSTLTMMNSLAAAGNIDAAKSSIKDMFAAGGALASLGLDPEVMAEQYSYMTQAERDISSTMLDFTYKMAASGNYKAEDIKGILSTLAAQFPESQYLQELKNNADFGSLLISATGQSARDEFKQKADDIIEGLDQLTEAQMPQAKSTWMEYTRKEYTEGELNQKAIAWSKLPENADEAASLSGDALVDAYLNDRWEVLSTGAENFTAPAVNSLFNSIKSSSVFNGQMTAEQEKVVRSAIATYMEGNKDATSVDPTTLVKENPDIYLAFNDFNGVAWNAEGAQPKDSYDAEKKVYDKVIQYAKGSNLDTLTPEEFDDIYDMVSTIVSNPLTGDIDTASLLDPKTLYAYRNISGLGEEDRSSLLQYSSLSSKGNLLLGKSAATGFDQEKDASRLAQILKKADPDKAIEIAKDLLGAPELSFSTEDLLTIQNGDGLVKNFPQSSLGRVVLIDGIPYAAVFTGSGDFRAGEQARQGRLVPLIDGYPSVNISSK